MLYLTLLVLLSPVIAWRYFVQGKNRRGWSQKLTGRVPIRESNAPCIWIHAVSVGEVILLETLILEFQRQLPDHEIVISTTTESGYDLARQRYAGLSVFFCPADFSWAVRRGLKRVRPSLLLLSELELWPNLVSTAHQRGIPVAVVNGRLSSGSFRGYHWTRWISKPMIEKISLFCVQTERYALRFIKLGAHHKKVRVTGSVKFDSAGKHASVEKVTQLRRLAGVTDKDAVWLAGSTQENEDRLIIETFAKLQRRYENLKLILVPRHPNRCGRLKRVFDKHDVNFRLRSKHSTENPSGSRVLLVDVIGELSAWWGVADMGYVGGSMGSRGGQNMIEPAACSVPISFGPDTENFQSVVELLLAGKAAEVVCSQQEMQDFVVQNLDDPKLARAMGMRAANVVQQQKGAAVRTVRGLRENVLSSATEATKSDVATNQHRDAA